MQTIEPHQHLRNRFVNRCKQSCALKRRALFLPDVLIGNQNVRGVPVFDYKSMVYEMNGLVRADLARKDTTRDMNHSIPTSLEHFDRLPDAARVREPTVCGLPGISRATVWRRVKSGSVPAPVRDGSVTSWQVGKLQKRLASLEGR